MNNTNQFTRLQYLNNECTHEQYYNQLVTDSIKRIVLSNISKDKLIAAFNDDEHFNTIKLPVWDSIGRNFQVVAKLNELGDTKTLSGLVCIAKAAAKQIVNNI